MPISRFSHLFSQWNLPKPLHSVVQTPIGAETQKKKAAVSRSHCRMEPFGNLSDHFRRCRITWSITCAEKLYFLLLWGVSVLGATNFVNDRHFGMIFSTGAVFFFFGGGYRVSPSIGPICVLQVISKETVWANLGDTSEPIKLGISDRFSSYYYFGFRSYSRRRLHKMYQVVSYNRTYLARNAT